jgi:hypothetical protein
MPLLITDGVFAYCFGRAQGRCDPLNSRCDWTQGAQRGALVHGAAWGRMGPHGAWHGARPKNIKLARGRKKKKARGRLLFAALALPSKHPIPADLFITDLTG